MCIRDRDKTDWIEAKTKSPLSEFVTDPKVSYLLEYCINTCLLYTSDAADERSSVDLGGRRIIKKKKRNTDRRRGIVHKKR